MLSRRRKPKNDKAGNPPRKSGPPNSLFGEILDWMLAPLLFLWPISIIVTHNVADNIANSGTTGYKRSSTEFSSLIIPSTSGNYTSGGVTTAATTNAPTIT